MTLIDVDGTPHDLAGDTTVVEGAALAGATGWALRPEGLCRGATCVPLHGRTVTTDDDRIDLVPWAEVLDLVLAADAAHAVAAVVPGPDGRTAGTGDEAPDLALPALDGTVHRLSDAAGRKRVLVTWASWCGCRHELAAWQALRDELADEGLEVFSVALDDDPEAARPWVEEADPHHPVVVDTAHVTAERYGITNVPSVVWIDEDGRIAKAPTIAPGDDRFQDFTGIAADVHHDALRRWVRDGELPDHADKPTAAARTRDEVEALAERRVASWLHTEGHAEAAAHHLRRAVELAPWDWTIRRGGIALRGGDPFLGEEFLAFWEEWDAAGRPGYSPTR